ncbi:MAG: hypothetical protein AUG51_10315 [Acidobacteria bacterium 13_1_20CM_3_53_8]|nr:MAG: hypothetical protein AUG51_10315 [Acidobacteria bacterium 13_1_20CM_3_53_8]
MKTYILLFVISLGASLLLTPIVRRLCERLKLLDEPHDERRLHRKAIPRLGGIAIFLSIGLSLSALLFVDNLLTRSLREHGSQIRLILLTTALVLLLGIYDDLRGANARVKFVSLALVASLLYWAGGRVEALSIPFVGSIHLPMWAGFCLTVVWTVGISNAFNLIDGLDGLAAGAALFSSLTLLIVSLLLGNPVVIVFALVLSGTLVGFLRYNFNPASIFLGDSGALSIGFLLAALSVTGAQKASTAVVVAIPLLAFGLPVLDTGFTMARRFISRKPLFEGDREHIHHMLVARGWSQRRTALALYGACAVLGLASLLFVGGTGTVTGLVLFVLAFATVIAVHHLRYHEVEEIKAGVIRNITERHARLANNINVRRASRALSNATCLADIFSVIERMLEAGEFDHASVQLGRGGDVERNERAVAEEKREGKLRGVEIRQGLIVWSWERKSFIAEELSSSRFWTLRLPLATDKGGWGYISLYREIGSEAILLDINYLCDLFQRELASASERVLCSVKDEKIETVAVGTVAGAAS